MLRVAKPAGFGNVVLEEAPVPDVGPREVLVRNKVSLISRGSEILRRYMRDEAIDPAIMGYSVAGVVEQVGAEAARQYKPGDRVICVSPHAQYVIQDIDAMDGTGIWPLPDALSFEEGAFMPLATGGVTWADIPGIRPNHTVVVLGQGLVGNLVMQAARQYMLHRLIAVDMFEARCRLAQQLGADVVINGSQQDAVAVVKELTGGVGADIVVDCVGGRGGIASFNQAQDMARVGGTIHLIGLYHGEPLQLDAGKIQRRRLIGGYFHQESRATMSARTLEMAVAGKIQVTPLISHRFPFTQAKEAYDLLYERPAEAMGVLLIWEED